MLSCAERACEDLHPAVVFADEPIKRIEITIGRQCGGEKLNSHSRLAAGTRENIKSFHAFLDNFQGKV